MKFGAAAPKLDTAEAAEVSSIIPPKPRAPSVLEQANALASKVAELDASRDELELAEAEGKPGSKAALEKYHAEFAAAQLALDGKLRAHKLALRKDIEAAKEHTEKLRAIPAEILIAGITVNKCPSLCHADGCAIACGINLCMHPRRSGVPPQFQNDPTIRQIHLAAQTEVLRQEKKR